VPPNLAGKDPVWTSALDSWELVPCDGSFSRRHPATSGQAVTGVRLFAGLVESLKIRLFTKERTRGAVGMRWPVYRFSVCDGQQSPGQKRGAGDEPVGEWGAEGARRRGRVALAEAGGSLHRGGGGMLFYTSLPAGSVGTCRAPCERCVSNSDAIRK